MTTTKLKFKVVLRGESTGEKEEIVAIRVTEKSAFRAFNEWRETHGSDNDISLLNPIGGVVLHFIRSNGAAS